MESTAAPGANPEDEEDVWYDKDKLFRVSAQSRSCAVVMTHLH
jgi:hypothetical protein